MTAPKKAPAFQFYASAWLASASVTRMEPEVEGTYLRLLCHQWQLHVAEEGELLPIDPAEVRRLTKLDVKQWATAWTRLEKHFPQFDGGRANPTLLAVWEERNAFVRGRRANGGAGGRPKKETKTEPTGNHVVSSRLSPPEPTAKRDESSVVCSLRSDTTPAADAASPSVSLGSFQPLFDELCAAGLPHEVLALEVLVLGLGAGALAAIGAIHAIASGMHVIRSERTGRAADAADVMQALADMAANGDKWNVNRFRGYVGRVVNQPPQPPSTEEREAARLAKQIAEVAKLPPLEPDTPEQAAARAKAREEAMARFKAEFRRQNPAEEPIAQAVA